MRPINIHQARRQFSKLIDAALLGTEVVIAKAGKPVAKLVAISEEKPKRRFGLLKGKIKIAKDFDAPLTEDLQRSI